MRQEHEFPARQRLVHREFDNHIAIGICLQIRKEEHGLVEIGSHLHIAKVCVATTVIALGVFS